MIFNLIVNINFVVLVKHTHFAMTDEAFLTFNIISLRKTIRKIYIWLIQDFQ